MFYIFSSDDTHRLFLVGILAGRKAFTAQRWMETELPANDTLILEGVPIIAFSATEAARSDHQNATWHFGSAHLVRSARPGWSWAPGITMMPPQAYTFTRTFRLGVALAPTYICLGFGQDGVPLLAVASPPVIGPFIIRPAQMVNVATVNTRADPQCRKEDPNNNKRRRDHSPDSDAGPSGSQVGV